MKRLPRFILSLAFASTLLASACIPVNPVVENTPIPSSIPSVPSIATITNTPDPCAPDNLEASVQAVHRFMREFDDASSLAASRPKEQLSDSIAELQRIRRDAEDQLTPPCLISLKTYQVSHMNSVINTLIAFMGGTSQEIVDQGIALAREQHDQYTLELARVLGLTIVPGTVLPLASDTPAP